MSPNYYTLSDSAEGEIVKWNYTLPGNGALFANLLLNFSDEIDVSLNGEPFCVIDADPSNGPISINAFNNYYFTPLGSFSRGDIVSFAAIINRKIVGGAMNMDVFFLNHELFELGYAELSDEPLVITKFTDTLIEGSIFVKNSGLLYTSLPFENRWEAYADGAKSEIIPIDGCMLSLPLEAGEHKIVLKYKNNALTAGIAVSASCFAAFVVLLFFKGGRCGK